jgi:hypothetical protein
MTKQLIGCECKVNLTLTLMYFNLLLFFGINIQFWGAFWIFGKKWNDRGY